MIFIILFYAFISYLLLFLCLNVLMLLFPIIYCLLYDHVLTFCLYLCEAHCIATVYELCYINKLALPSFSNSLVRMCPIEVETGSCCRNLHNKMLHGRVQEQCFPRDVLQHRSMSHRTLDPQGAFSQ